MPSGGALSWCVGRRAAVSGAESLRRGLVAGAGCSDSGDGDARGLLRRWLRGGILRSCGMVRLMKGVLERCADPPACAGGPA